MNSKKLKQLLDAQHKALAKIALGDSLKDSLYDLCAIIEHTLDDKDARTSILQLKGEQLYTIATPSLPRAYCASIDGIHIGPNVGSCGTAAFTKQQVIVSDIENDPLWRDYKQLALQHSLKACWSTPLLSSDHQVLGSFAIYYNRVKSPDPFHLELIDRFTNLASLAIEKHQAQQREQSLIQALKTTNDKLQTLLSVLPDLAVIIDEHGTYVDLFGGDSAMLFDTQGSLLGRHVADLFPKNVALKVMETIDGTLSTGEIQSIEFSLNVRKGLRYFEGRSCFITHYAPDEPEKRHVLWMTRDVTAKKQAEQRSEQLAFYDPLTNLPNRRLLSQRLGATAERVAKSNQLGALLYLDMDDFKRINDSLGHSVGDTLLTKVANRLKRIVGPTDTLARIGGDEFVVILDQTETDSKQMLNEAAAVARKLLDSFQQTFTLDNADYKFGGSIGITLIEPFLDSPDIVLKQADTAMYRAKKMGGNQFVVYERALQDVVDTRLQIEREIVASINDREFCAYFQPQISPQGLVIGAEALIRWNHPEKGVISPAHFIPVAEQSGNIKHLQNIVIEDTCQLLLDLKKQQLLTEDFSVAINVSASQFTDRLDQVISEIIDRYGIEPRQIKLELTESTLISDVEGVVTQINWLKQKHFSISIDDFGTGYSSLAYLQTFPIDQLKIDRSFTNAIHPGEGGTAIIDALISLSEHLGFEVIVEGVETKLQADLLVQRSIAGMQGYYYSRPLPANEFIDWLKSQLQ